MHSPDKRLVAVSNRLPVVLREVNGCWKAEAGIGGLVTALSPVFRNRKGLWIGWPGVTDKPAEEVEQVLTQNADNDEICYKPVTLSQQELEGYYHGFSNEVLWPLFHDLHSQCNFDPDYWGAYLSANRKFAETVARNAGERGDVIWIQDYHLIMTGQLLRELDVDCRIAFFLHTPFPPLDLLLKLPWRYDILFGMLSYDLIGFQTERDRHNFTECLNILDKNAIVEKSDGLHVARIDGREVRIGHFPISIDYDEFAGSAKMKEVQREALEIKKCLNTDCIVLGIDRLDYTKGIPERLSAFEAALGRFPELHANITFVQVVVPSRENIPKYQKLKEEIDRLVSRINGRFTKPGWVPVHYMFRHLKREELLAYYQAADVALITPLKDGMNLVAKEYCAANVDETGVLILSEFAGASAQLNKGALLVNPYDIDGVAQTIKKAYEMDLPERRRRMNELRRVIRISDIYRWKDSFMDELC